MIQNMCMIKRNYQYKIISPNNLYTRVFFIHKGNPPPVHNKIMLKVKKENIIFIFKTFYQCMLKCYYEKDTKKERDWPCT